MPGSSSAWGATVTERRPGFFWPLGAPLFLLAAALVFGMTLIRTGGSLSWTYQEWAHTNSLFESTAVDLTAPIAAAFGAYLSGRLTPPSRLYALPRFSRDSAQFLAHSLGPAALVVTLGYLLAVVPVLVQTGRTATAGSFDPAGALGGVLVLNTMLVLGWLIGLLAQSAFAAPVAFALAFAATVMGYSAGAWNAVTPVIADLGAVGIEQAPSLTVFRFSFFFIVLVVALVTAAGVLSTRGFSRRRPPLRYALLWLLPVAFVAIAIARPPASYLREAAPPQVCRTDNGVEYCLHRAHEKDLGPLIDEVSPLITLVGRTNLPFDRIVDWSLSDGSTPSRDSRTFYAAPSPEYGVVGIRSEIAYQISGVTVCSARPGREEGEQGRNSFMLSTRLNGAHQDSPDNRFGRLTDQELRQWLTRNRVQAGSCDITDALLP
jgi:hypothetical protein